MTTDNTGFIGEPGTGKSWFIGEPGGAGKSWQRVLPLTLARSVVPAILGGSPADAESDLLAQAVAETAGRPTLSDIARALEVQADRNAVGTVPLNKTAVLGRDLARRLRAVIASTAPRRVLDDEAGQIGGPFRPVLLDPAYRPEDLNQGSSIGLVGAQGASPPRPEFSLEGRRRSDANEGTEPGPGDCAR